MLTTRRMRKRMIRACIIGGSLLIWLVMFIRVNAIHPPIPVKTYHLHETFTIGSREITVLDYTVVSGEETKALLKETNESWFKDIIDNRDPTTIRMGLLKVNVKNIGAQALHHGYGPIAGLMITPVDTLSYCYNDVSDMLNEKEYGGDFLQLQSGEERIYTIAYFLDSDWMSAAWWSKVDTMPYEFIIAQYPTEIRISTATL